MSRSVRILLCALLLTAAPAWGQISVSTLGPAITSITPTSIPVGTPGFTLTVYGKNFVAGNATITWNGIALPTTFVASGKLYATVPGKFLTTVGTAKIAVAARLGSTPAVAFNVTSSTQSTTTSTQSDALSSQSDTSSALSNTTNPTQSELGVDTKAIFALAPSPLPGGAVGITYRIPLVKGGTAPYAFFLAGGALPPGLTFDAPTGMLAGVPKAAANYAFAVSIKDAVGHAASSSYAMSVAPSGSSPTQQDSITSSVLRIATTSLPGGYVKTVYKAVIAVTGGTAPYKWVLVSGNLPPGVTLDSATGTIYGTPTMGGNFSFMVSVVDSSRGSASYTYSIGISALAKPL